MLANIYATHSGHRRMEQRGPEVKSRSRKLKRRLANITMLPSGVSSAKELNCAASANCFSYS